MPRERDYRRDQAFKIYKEHKGDIDLVEIASQLNLPSGTIRGWKAKDNWEEHLNGTLPNNTERSKKTKGPPDDGTKATMRNEKLTYEKRLFCIYYSKSFNATQSYLKAYGCSYDSAKAHGYELLLNVDVKKELQRLNEIKRQQIVANEADMIEFHMRIAFADMGDYVSFGQKEAPIITEEGILKDNEGKEITRLVNVVDLKESSQVDTQLIKEVKQGKDGIAIKLLDRCKSLDWLDKYFLMNPMDNHKREYDNKKLEIERERLLLEKERSAKDVIDKDITVELSDDLKEWSE